MKMEAENISEMLINDLRQHATILKWFLCYITRSAPTFVQLELRLRIIRRTDFNKNTFVWGPYAILYSKNVAFFKSIII
jgi:hypothetical protein